MSYTDKAEVTREYYRKQGENRERERILKILAELNTAFGQTSYLAYVPDFIVTFEKLIQGEKNAAN